MINRPPAQNNPSPPPTLLGRFLGDEHLAELWRRRRSVDERWRLRAALAQDLRQLARREGRAAPTARPPARASADVAALAERVGEAEEAIVRLLAQQRGSPNGEQ